MSKRLVLPLVPFFAFFFVWSLSHSPIVHAATCQVPSEQPTIQDALDTSSCDVIVVGNGVFAENLVISRTVTVQGQGADNTIISGNHSGRVVAVTPGITVTLQNLALQHGFLDATSPTGGAGIYNNGSTLHLNNIHLTENHNTSTAAGNGGGLLNYTGTVHIENSLILSNTAHTSANGGGIYSLGGTVYVTNSTFIANEGVGGAIYNAFVSQLVITSSQFENNQTIRQGDSFVLGGAIHNDATSQAFIQNSSFSNNHTWGNDESGGGALFNAGTMTVTTSIFTDNEGRGDLSSGGGAIYNRGNLEVNESAFTENQGIGSFGGSGGAIRSFNGSLNISQSTFSYNAAQGDPVNYPSEGGAIAADTATITQSTFDHNEADACGGLNLDQATLTNSTISANQALTGAGGGICHSGAITITNSTIYANQTITGGAGIEGAVGTAYLLNTVVALNNGGNDCNGLVNAAATNLDSDGSCDNATTSTDPRLAPLGYYGGPTPTHPLWEDSPALDTGDDAICNAPPVNGVDQRGMTRPQGDHCDLGAFEGFIYPPAAYLPFLYKN